MEASEPVRCVSVEERPGGLAEFGGVGYGIIPVIVSMCRRLVRFE